MFHWTRLVRYACTSWARSGPGRLETSGTLCSKHVSSAQSALVPGAVAARRSVTTLPRASTDPQQERMLEEMCLLVDEQDAVVGAASKRDCHAWRADSCPLHRAFSVFLFDSSDRLLLQRRSDVKITFPGCLTNTCCSHPLNVASESEGSAGVITAAQRRLQFELGIEPEQVPTSAFQYLTRMHYRSPSGTDGVWGEHEMDYILVVRADVRLRPNANEVQAVEYVSRERLAEYLTRQQSAGVPLTPWFQLIVNTWLMRWWENLDRLHQFTDHDTIHRL